jgi:hypothetical protein
LCTDRPGTALNARRTQHLAHLGVTTQWALQQATLVLVLEICFTAKPALKGVVVLATQIKHFHSASTVRR